MFYFVVKYFGWLKSIPLAALLFDSFYKIFMLICKPALLDWLSDIETEVQTWPGMSLSLHRYGGTQFNHHGKELGHMHSNGLVDIRFSRAIKIQLL